MMSAKRMDDILVELGRHGLVGVIIARSSDEDARVVMHQTNGTQQTCTCDGVYVTTGGFALQIVVPQAALDELGAVEDSPDVLKPFDDTH